MCICLEVKEQKMELKREQEIIGKFKLESIYNKLQT